MAFSLFRGEIHSRRHFLRALTAAGSAALFMISPALLFAQQKPADVAALVRTVLAAKQGYQPGDILSQGDAKAVLDTLAKAGLKVSEQDEILKLLLEDGSFLVKELRSPPGVKFMRGVARDPIPFDRLDRLSGMPGGERLVHDIIRLPNGQTYMSKKPTPGFTDLTTLLPKQANGKTPVNKDFNKPTGRIYTEAALVEAIQKSLVKR
jgi:hypothetical protein